MKKILLRRQGFTLIELLIVIVIIGILAVGFAPSLLNAPKKARDGVRKGQLAGIKQAVDAYALDKNSQYPVSDSPVCIDPANTVGSALAPYFQGNTLPKDQNSKDQTCSDGYGFWFQNAKDKCYMIYSKLEVAGTGNMKGPKDCSTDTVSDNSGDYYGIVQKY